MPAPIYGDDHTFHTEDYLGRRIQPILFNSQVDGSGAFRFPVVNDQSRIEVASKRYLLDIAEGNIDNHARFSMNGTNPDVAAAWENVWDYGGLYTYLTTAAAMYISSSDNGDTQDYIVVGLDANWDEQSVTVTATGQTQARVGTTETFIRVLHCYNAGATDNAGDIYIAESDSLTAGVPDTASKVKCMIRATHNSGFSGHYSVPNGKTAYLMDVVISAGTLKQTDVHFRYRAFGGVFLVARELALYGTSFVANASIPHSIPAKTDVDLVAFSTGGGGFVSVALAGWVES